MSKIKIKEAINALSANEILEDYAIEEFDYLKNLNPRQKLAATRKEGNYLVIAGPGTGKTHTLAYRVVHLIKQGVDPMSIVVITFTRKAGNELKNRINRLLPNTSIGFVGTFHAFSNHISNLIGHASPISKFRLLDQEDDVSVHKLVMADFKHFNKNIRAKQLQKIISYCMNAQMDVGTYINTFDLHEYKSDIGNIEAYQKQYEAYKVDHMLANYDDMIVLVAKYLEKEKETKVTAPYEYLMIDEYQDTNQMQLDFIRQLNIKNIMAIGDDFQGIYAFRGADHRIILNFYNDFEDAKMIKLVENYRSSAPIIDKINKTVEKSQLGYQKALEITQTEEGQATIISGESLEKHKDFIINNIKAHRDETHALIYRFNKHRTVFEKALIQEQIEYSVYGGIRLLERKHVKDVMAFLMVYLNRRDVVSFSRILTLVPGVGPKTARYLIHSELNDFSKLSGAKLNDLMKIRNILTSRMEKSELFDKVCEFYFSIFEHVASEFYTREEIAEDFKLIKELLNQYESLHNFIINLILDPVVDMHKGKNPKVILTTIHSAKGLEFDRVYYFHTHDWYRNYDVEQLEEDRRLFYVGISRAKRLLYIFDHTEFKRDFEGILRDFENGSMLIEPEEKPKEVATKEEMMHKFKSLRKTLH
ncbi:MAG: ATP-dependent helicase [Clostridia bacterium]|nr:ATP-dependent helicase [Clostridia bacterium]